MRLAFITKGKMMLIRILVLVTIFCNFACAAIDKTPGAPKRLREKLTVDQRIYYRALPLEERLVIDAYLETPNYTFQQAIRQMRRDLMCPYPGSLKAASK